MPVLELESDAPILRKPTLSDVQLRHDFEATDYRRGQVRWRRGRFLKNAVDPVSNPKSVRICLEVYIRCSRFESLQNKEVNELHDGCFVGEVHEIVKSNLSCSWGRYVGGQTRNHLLRGVRIDPVGSANNR